MDEAELRRLLGRAIESEPPPIASTAHRALQAGRRLRRRRRSAGAAAVASATAAAVVVVAGGVPSLTGVFGGPPASAPRAPANPFAYVATSAGTVVPISLRTGKAGAPIKLTVHGNYPQAMAITPDGKTVYVATSGGDITPISTATDKAGKPIRVGNQATSITIAPDGRTALVTLGNGVVPINLGTGRAGKLIKIDNLGQLILAPGGKTAYCTSMAPVGAQDEISRIAISAGTGRLLTPIKLGIRDGYPTAITLVPASRTGYVVFEPAGIGMKSEAADVQFDLANGTVSRPIPENYDLGIDVPVAGATAFIGASHQALLEVDLASGTAHGPIALPEQASGPITMAPDGRTAYIVADQTGDVIPLNLRTGIAGKPLKWGQPGWQNESANVAPYGDAVVSESSPVAEDSARYNGIEIPVRANGQVGKAINVGGQGLEIVFTPAAG
jgi:DNA-binding beta-propeller fold protein YncE